MPACSTRVCSITVSAAFSKAGIELAGELNIVADPHFVAPEQVDFEGCVTLSVRPSPLAAPSTCACSAMHVITMTRTACRTVAGPLRAAC